MKTNPPTTLLGFARPAFALLAVVLPVMSQAAAAEASVVPKTHTLFMGADIDLQQAKGFVRVENVSGGSFVIKVDGKEKTIPMKFNSVNMKVDHSLKLTETSATVGKLVVDRVYTEGKDPNKKFIREQAAASADAQLANDNYKLLALQLVASRAGNGVGVGAYGSVGAVLMVTGREFGDTPGDGPDAIANQLAAVERSYQASANALGSDQNNAGFGANKLAGALAEGMFDAIEITFEVSSEKPLNSPYAVVLAQFSEQGAKPNEVQNWIYATELDQITSETRRVRIKQGGFPPGFEIKNYQLHLYNRGQELATTVASKRVELTRDEAFDYVLIDHLVSHKGQTLPATLAMGRLPVEVRNNLPAPALYVKVSRDGLPVAAFADEACTRKIDDPALESALHNLRFKPALDKGKAVDGVARLGSS